jgi:hypothetical protein
MTGLFEDLQLNDGSLAGDQTNWLDDWEIGYQMTNHIFDSIAESLTDKLQVPNCPLVNSSLTN